MFVPIQTMKKSSPDLFKTAQRADLALGIVSLLVALYFALGHEYGWATLALLGALVSFASAKFMPAKWLMRRFLVAQTK